MDLFGGEMVRVLKLVSDSHWSSVVLSDSLLVGGGVGLEGAGAGGGVTGATGIATLGVT